VNDPYQAAGEATTAGDLQRLYRDAIRTHSTSPVGYGVEIGATHRREEYNPQCGDRIEVMLRVAGETVEAAAFDGEACAICMASASLLCSLAPGCTTGELEGLGDGLKTALVDSGGPLLHPELEPLLGVRPYPSRVQCAWLPWKAARRALGEPINEH
jgi:nitrogen fixation NifU-like protein